MICDSNYVKKVDTCKGAANRNRYAGAFITDRQLINDRGAAVRRAGLSFTQLPVSLTGRGLHRAKAAGQEVACKQLEAATGQSRPLSALHPPRV